jgi:hypothetical protein
MVPGEEGLQAVTSEIKTSDPQLLDQQICDLLDSHANGNVAYGGRKALQVGTVNPNREDVFFAFELDRTSLGASKLVVGPYPGLIFVGDKDDAKPCFLAVNLIQKSTEILSPEMFGVKVVIENGKSGALD